MCVCSFPAGPEAMVKTSVEGGEGEEGVPHSVSSGEDRHPPGEQRAR